MKTRFRYLWEVEMTIINEDSVTIANNSKVYRTPHEMISCNKKPELP